jgi:hypothetical protein
MRSIFAINAPPFTNLAAVNTEVYVNEHSSTVLTHYSPRDNYECDNNDNDKYQISEQA